MKPRSSNRVFFGVWFFWSEFQFYIWIYKKKRKMKHIKLFENFSLKVLPPVDISRSGEVVVAFEGDESFCVTLISESELPMLQKALGFEGLPTSQQHRIFTYFKKTREPGIAYVYYTGATKGDHDCEFVGPEFESKTPYMFYWMTGNGSTANNDYPHTIQKWQQDLDGENWDGVFVLKRGMVLEMSPGYEPSCHEYNIDEYCENMSNLTRMKGYQVFPKD